jgi:hypothetical protein
MKFLGQFFPYPFTHLNNHTLQWRSAHRLVSGPRVVVDTNINIEYVTTKCVRKNLALLLEHWKISMYRESHLDWRCGSSLQWLINTTGKTAFAVRQMICRALSIGRTAKATLCRACTTCRTAPINARCRSLCRASFHRRTAKSGLCRASDQRARQRGPGTCTARDTADGWGGR